VTRHSSVAAVATESSAEATTEDASAAEAKAATESRFKRQKEHNTSDLSNQNNSNISIATRTIRIFPQQPIRTRVLKHYTDPDPAPTQYLSGLRSLAAHSIAFPFRV